MTAQPFVQSVATSSKKLAIDVDSIAASTTRTMTAPDIDITLGSVTAGTSRRGTKYSATNVLSAQPKVQTLTDAASITWDVDSGYTATVTLAGNRTLAAITNMEDGDTCMLRVVQDGTGSRTLAYNAIFKWPSGTAPTLSTAANAVDLISFVKLGGNIYGNAAKAFA